DKSPSCIDVANDALREHRPGEVGTVDIEVDRHVLGPQIRPCSPVVYLRRDRDRLVGLGIIVGEVDVFRVDPQVAHVGLRAAPIRHPLPVVPAPLPITRIDFTAQTATAVRWGRGHGYPASALWAILNTDGKVPG